MSIFFLEWHVIYIKVNYVVSCLGWIVPLTWCMYECEYVMSWLRMLKPLSLVYVKYMRPKMMLRVSFMWNLGPSAKVMNVEVESHNVLKTKEL